MKLRFKLNHLYQGQNAPFLHAVDAGLFERAGVDVTFIEGFSSSQVTRAILEDEADFGFGDVSSVIESAIRTGDDSVRCLLPIFTRSPCALGYHRRQRPLTLTDIDGAALCGPQGDTSARLLPALLARNGLSHIRYHFTAVTPEERDRLIASRSVLAATCFDATLKFAMRMRGCDSSDLEFLYFADHGLDAYTAGVIYRRDAFADKPGLAGEIVGIIRKAWQDCREDRGLGVEAVLRRAPAMDPVIVRDQLEWVLGHQVFLDDRPQLAFDFQSERWLNTIAVACFGFSGSLSVGADSVALAAQVCDSV